MRIKLQKAKLAIAFALGCGITGNAWPQDYPVRAVRWVLPGPAGGGVDVIARPIAQKLSELLGQPVVIENRAGGSGLIAGQTVASTPPDGHVILLGTTGTHSIMPLLVSKPPYDPLHDFAPVTLIGTAPLLAAAHPALPVTSMSELMTLARKRPGQVLFASNGTGSIHHLCN